MYINNLHLTNYKFPNTLNLILSSNILPLFVGDVLSSPNWSVSNATSFRGKARGCEGEIVLGVLGLSRAASPRLRSAWSRFSHESKEPRAVLRSTWQFTETKWEGTWLARSAISSFYSSPKLSASVLLAWHLKCVIFWQFNYICYV